MSGLRIAIVGLGPWGLCVLERLLSAARPSPRRRTLQIHGFEPNLPGGGVHDPGEPDYLLLNTVAGQVSLFAGADRDGLAAAYGGKSFLEWLEDEGYTLTEDGPRISPHGGRIGAGDFLPRALFGRYAQWCYRRLVAALPPGVQYEHHRECAVQIQALPNGMERITADSGRYVDVHHVFLTTGHTPARPNGRRVAAYPAAALNRRVAAGATVAVSGMGLVAVDAVTALTVGRGGRFLRGAGRLRYVASGEEPRIRLFSRSGLCFQCRPASTLDSTGTYAPCVFSREAIAALRDRKQCREGTRQLDFEREVAPLLWAELRIHYHTERTRLAQGDAAAATLRDALAAAWRAGRFESALAPLPGFDPESECFRPDIDLCRDSDHYQALVRAALEADLEDCRAGERDAPRKAAFELFRVLRDVIRAAVDDSGLTPPSAAAFQARFAGAFNRVAVGPPLRRGEELLALLDSGIVSLPFGREPWCRPGADGQWIIGSSRLRSAHVEAVDAIIAGHLDPPGLEGTASPLWADLAGQGRVRPFQPGPGIDLDADHHPLDRDGAPNPRLWVLGPPAEGVRYFTNYLPSPKSRFQAFEDADRCLRSIFSAAGWD